MDDIERQQLLERIDTLKRRRHILQLQRDEMGVHTPAHVIIEIKKIDSDLFTLQKSLGIYTPIDANLVKPLKYIIEQENRTFTESLSEQLRTLKYPLLAAVILWMIVLSATRPSPNTILFRTNTPIPTIAPNYPQTWEQGGFILTLENVTYDPRNLLLRWSLTNNTQYQIDIPLQYYERFYAKDNFGNIIEMRTMNCYSTISADYDCRTMGTYLSAGTQIQFTQQLDWTRETSKASEITISADNLPGTEYAVFHIPIER